MPAMESRRMPSTVSMSFMDGSFWNNAQSADRSLTSPSVKIEADSRAIVNGPRSVQKRARHSRLRHLALTTVVRRCQGGLKAVSAQPRPAAALAFDHFVALLQQALALAILALLLLLDVGAFFIGHNDLQIMFVAGAARTSPGRTYRDGVMRSPFIACIPRRSAVIRGPTPKRRTGMPARRDSPLPTRSSRGSWATLSPEF